MSTLTQTGPRTLVISRVGTQGPMGPMGALTPDDVALMTGLATDAETAASQSAASALAASQSETAAEMAKTLAETAKTDADVAASNASTSATAAQTARTGAETARGGAETAASSASLDADEAETARAAAATAASQASTSATNADSAKTAAASSASAAASSASAADTAKVAAETARTAAQTAATNADSSKTAAAGSASAAATSATNANTAKVAAETAKTAAETARTAAQTAATNADASKTAAATSETNAATSATNADTSRVAAQTAQTAAEAAATAANGLADARIEAFKETFISLPNAPTADAAGLLGVEFGEMFRNGSTLSVSTSINSIFAGGAPGAVYDLSDMSTLYQDAAGTTPVTAAGQPIGLLRDKSGRGNDASQVTTTMRPLVTQLNNRYTLLGDNVDDILTAPNTVDGDLLWASPYGWMRSDVRSGPVSLPLAGMKQAVLHSALTSAQVDQVGSYFGVPRQYMVMVTRNTVLNNLRVYTGGGTTTLTAIGINGVTATLLLSANASVSWDLGAAGLTMPATVLVPMLNDAALTRFVCNSNNFSGIIPKLFANTTLVSFDCSVNKLTGSIPNLSANTTLTFFSTAYNQLTGSIPNISANTSLTTFNCSVNQLTDYAGGSVSSTLGEFYTQNNLLSATAINALLAAFVAAGRTSANGTCILNLGGAGNAAPTGQGLTDKATLVSRGWTVTTN